MHVQGQFKDFPYFAVLQPGIQVDFMRLFTIWLAEHAWCSEDVE